LSNEEAKYQMTIKDTVATITASEIIAKSKDFLQKIPLKDVRAVEVKVDLKLMILASKIRKYVPSL